MRPGRARPRSGTRRRARDGGEVASRRRRRSRPSAGGCCSTRGRGPAPRTSSTEAPLAVEPEVEAVAARRRRRRCGRSGRRSGTRRSRSFRRPRPLGAEPLVTPTSSSAPRVPAPVPRHALDPDDRVRGVVTGPLRPATRDYRAREHGAGEGRGHGEDENGGREQAQDPDPSSPLRGLTGESGNVDRQAPSPYHLATRRDKRARSASRSSARTPDPTRRRPVRITPGESFRSSTSTSRQHRKTRPNARPHRRPRGSRDRRERTVTIGFGGT